ncbi:sodium:proton exchanger [Piscinibacter koreensis]|uniref:sodium:proton exchanger n=1 Tax=Piscinibacter koreensis TaxID=2742824 RepID=UPI001FEC9B38|nr:sodium:proton exchanger [Schlegelella koreensis]
MTFLAVAVIAIIPALVLRLMGWRPGPVIDTVVFGIAVLAAGFMLSWGAEAAEKRISQGLILALVALVTVLPEYAVDMYYAYQAGKAPDSNYVHYAAANMTGANRLLVGLAWPLMGILHWLRTRQRSIQMASVNVVEIGFLLVASLYAFVIVLKNRIDVFDSAVLVLLFGAYLWMTGRMPKADEALTQDDEPGPAAALSSLSPARQWVWMAGLTFVAAAVILASAEPFAESIVASGRVLGIDEFLLIQWLAPLASESPAVVIAVLFVLSGRAEGGLTTMISDKINQWTLLVGMLPLAMSVGFGGLTALPLDARQHEEFFLTAAQSLFGVALLLRLRFSLLSALALALLFAVQLVIAFIFRTEPSRAIASLTILAWVYLVLAALVFVPGAPGAWRAVVGLRAKAAKSRLDAAAKPGSGAAEAARET